MTVELLRYANRAKVAEALTSRGYEVTRMTVNRWARGNEMPVIAERMILALFGHETQNEPPPAGRLETKLDMVLWALRISQEEQADLLARRARGEAWPPRDNDEAQAGGAARSANAP